MNSTSPFDKMPDPDNPELPEETLSPSWHEDVLRAREKRFEEGKTSFEDWDEAKRRLREEVP